MSVSLQLALLTETISCSSSTSIICGIDLHSAIVSDTDSCSRKPVSAVVANGLELDITISSLPMLAAEPFCSVQYASSSFTEICKSGLKWNSVSRNTEQRCFQLNTDLPAVVYMDMSSARLLERFTL